MAKQRTPKNAYEAYINNPVVISGDDKISRGAIRAGQVMEEQGAAIADLLF